VSALQSAAGGIVYSGDGVWMIALLAIVLVIPGMGVVLL
jgi:hypothetical protein